MQLTSTAFEHTKSIPSKYTCDGEKISPPLFIRGVPQGTISLVLIMEDPDVPKDRLPSGMFDHWVLFNISPDVSQILEGVAPACVSGVTTRGTSGYVSPCPPDREHRYFFKLFAVDILLDLSSSATKEEVLEAIRGHIIEQTELIGRYERTK